MENELPRKKLKRRPGGQKGNQNACRHGFYSPAHSPACTELCRSEISLVWNAVTVKSIDPAVAVIRVKLEGALLRDPSNHILLEDTAKVMTKHYSKELELDEFDRRQFRSAILGTIEASAAKQNEAKYSQVPAQDETKLNSLKRRRGTNRACQAQRSKQDESRVL